MYFGFECSFLWVPSKYTIEGICGPSPKLMQFLLNTVQTPSSWQEDQPPSLALAILSPSCSVDHFVRPQQPHSKEANDPPFHHFFYTCNTICYNNPHCSSVVYCQDLPIEALCTKRASFRGALLFQMFLKRKNCFLLGDGLIERVNRKFFFLGGFHSNLFFTSMGYNKLKNSAKILISQSCAALES